jgi:hypothetical protein
MIRRAQTIYHQHPESSYGFTTNWDTKVSMRFNNGQLMDCTAYRLMSQIVRYQFVELASLVQQRNDHMRRTIPSVNVKPSNLDVFQLITMFLF